MYVIHELPSALFDCSCSRQRLDRKWKSNFCLENLKGKCVWSCLVGLAIKIPFSFVLICVVQLNSALLWVLQLFKPHSRISWGASCLQRHLPQWHQSDLRSLPLSDHNTAYGEKKLQRLWPAVLSTARLIYLAVELLMTSLDLSQSVLFMSVMMEDYLVSSLSSNCQSVCETGSLMLP